jgi:hypothetical protein
MKAVKDVKVNEKLAEAIKASENPKEAGKEAAAQSVKKAVESVQPKKSQPPDPMAQKDFSAKPESKPDGMRVKK